MGEVTTLRDEFATMALASLLTAPTWTLAADQRRAIKSMGQQAHLIADAMMEARATPPASGGK